MYRRDIGLEMWALDTALAKSAAFLRRISIRQKPGIRERKDTA